jgi:CubicO group peptidase (beta-lactamase class C family)
MNGFASFVCALALAGCASTSAIEDGLHPTQASVSETPLSAAIRTYVTEAATQRGFSGVVLAARADDIVFNEAFGQADASGAPFTSPDTIFGIASITKAMTSTAIMVLVDRGALSLDAPVCAFIEPCPPHWRSIHVRHLMAQTSGIPNYLTGREPGLDIPTNAASILERLGRQPLVSEPGARFEYTNSNHFLLGLIIERVTGENYEAALRDLIFGPAGMTDTALDVRSLRLLRFAEAWSVGDDGASHAVPYIHVTWTNSASGLRSTSRDLFRLARALEDNRLMSVATKDVMWTRVTDFYALGWWRPPAPPENIVSATGGSHGYQGSIVLDRDRDELVIVLCNRTGDACSDIGYDVLHLLQ